MLEQLKQNVCQANLDLVAHGLVTLTWGNVSGLSDDRQHLAIKPSGVDYSQLRPEQIVIVNVATGDVAEGTLKPSSDTPTHRLLYQKFEGLGGITHTHSTKATAWAQARRAIPCFGTTHADHFYGEVPVTRPLTQHEIETDYELYTGHVIVEAFADIAPLSMPGVLVASHAPFTWGASAAESVENAVALEAVADMAFATLTLNPTSPGVEQYLLDKHYFRKHGDSSYYGQT